MCLAQGLINRILTSVLLVTGQTLLTARLPAALVLLLILTCCICFLLKDSHPGSGANRQSSLPGLSTPVAGADHHAAGVSEGSGQATAEQGSAHLPQHQDPLFQTTVVGRKDDH